MPLRNSIKSAYFFARWHVGCHGRIWLERIERERLIAVLCFHHISPETDPFTSPVHPRLFDEVVRFIRNRIPILSFSELHDIRSGPAVVFSFDDGNHDFIDYAMPILARHRIRANQNVVPSCVETGNPIWNQQIYDFLSAAPASLLRSVELPGFGMLKTRNRTALGVHLSASLKNMSHAQREPILGTLSPAMDRLGDYRRTRVMSRAEVLQVAGEHDIGAHSFDHDSMQFESDGHFRRDVHRCQEYFSGTLKIPLKIYAFPNGSHRPEQATYVHSLGMHALLTGETLACSNDSERHIWPRITLRGKTSHELKLRAVGCVGPRTPSPAKNLQVCQ